MATTNEYISRPDQKDEAVEVVSDDAPVEDPMAGKDPDSSTQLGRDYKDTIKEGEKLDGRTRGDMKEPNVQTRGATAKGSYKEQDGRAIA